MKKFLAMCAVCLAATFATGALNAQEPKAMSEQDAQAAAAAEAEVFSQYETLDVESDDAIAKSLNGGTESKCCWFWYWRPVRYYYYPAYYYYYTWYCPVYYVNLRLVSYTVDVPTATVATASTTTSSSTTTTETSVEVVKTKSGQTAIAKGAVIDGKVKANSILAKKGLRSGDVITKIDGRPINSMNDVKNIKANSRITYVPGDKVKIAKKAVLQKKTDEVAKSYDGFKTQPVKLNDVKAAEPGMTLYDYYNKTVESAPEGNALQQTQEYGAYEY